MDFEEDVMTGSEKVQEWLQTNYDLSEEDSTFVAEQLQYDNREMLIDSFMPDESEEPEDLSSAVERVTDQVDRLFKAYKDQFQSDRPRPKHKPLTFVPAEPSPNVDVPEEEVHLKVAKESLNKAISKDKTKHTRARKVVDQSVAVDKPKTKRKQPEVQVTDISTPPEYPPSHGMGIMQIHLLTKLLESVMDKPFNKFDLNGGGISLDEARAGFATLLMRGGICEVVDAIKVKKSGKQFWGKKVIPILPMAREVIDDFKKRKPEKWMLIK